MRGGRAGGEPSVIQGEGKMEVVSGRCGRGVDAAARLDALRSELPSPSAHRPEALAEGRSSLGGRAQPMGCCSVECLVSRACAGWQDAGAGGEPRAGWEAPVGALEQDLGTETPQEVVDQYGATEESLGVIDEAHLLQGEA